MKLNNLYFFTATIKNWLPILQNDQLKDVIINSLRYLKNNDKIKIYGFVIMPNHIHLIWELIDMNGNEMPHSSFMKFTGHKIIRYLQIDKSDYLDKIKVNFNDRNYNLWKEKPMAIELYSPNVIYQKLDYIHNNPVKGKWMLAESPLEYKYTSARFYENGIDEFNVLNHIGDVI
ncbi:transposase [Marivirga harenae]|uniref:transposase n=1 Tax=Marivirga harenae TaxID=2010992 RepID=UPI0026E0C8D4|nr:transposase [Marivirga harenae]WKV12738.1 transposase [Marivirga harenae]